MSWLVATERLGWPRHRWWQVWPWEVQHRQQYDIEPERPTATCHLQPSDRERALCGYEWEGLIAIPGSTGPTPLRRDRSASRSTDRTTHRSDAVIAGDYAPSIGRQRPHTSYDMWVSSRPVGCTPGDRCRWPALWLGFSVRKDAVQEFLGAHSCAGSADRVGGAGAITVQGFDTGHAALVLASRP
jgi:hypothetical protein